MVTFSKNQIFMEVFGLTMIMITLIAFSIFDSENKYMDILALIIGVESITTLWVVTIID